MLSEFNDFLRDNLICPRVSTLAWDPMNGNGKLIVLTPFFSAPFSKKSVDDTKDLRFIKSIEKYISVIRAFQRSSFLGQEQSFFSFAKDYLKTHFPYIHNVDELKDLIKHSYYYPGHDLSEQDYFQSRLSKMVTPSESSLDIVDLLQEDEDNMGLEKWAVNVSHYLLSKAYMYGLGIFFPPLEIEKLYSE